MGSLKPLGDRVLVQRVDVGEKVLASGIVLPATREQTVQTKAEYFRAKVLAMSDDAHRQLPDLDCGEDVFVHSYSGNGQSVFTGEKTGGHGLMIKPDDIICVVEGE